MSVSPGCPAAVGTQDGWHTRACLCLPKGSTKFQQSPANSIWQRPGGPKVLSKGGVRLCLHLPGSSLTPMFFACATTQVTSASDFSMPNALRGYRPLWHLYLTHSAPAFTAVPSRNSNLPGSAHLQPWGEYGSPQVSADLGAAHQPWPHCCQWSVPAPQSPDPP